jgi:hypothetical protein
MIAADQPPRIGERPAELGRYVTAEGERRRLVAREVDGEVSVTDCSLSGGRAYFVEREFESMGELAVLVADYTREAERFGCCPMSQEALRALVNPPGHQVG